MVYLQGIVATEKASTATLTKTLGILETAFSIIENFILHVNIALVLAAGPAIVIVPAPSKRVG